MADSKAEQNLALKVMRLTRPTFGTEIAFASVCDTDESTWNLDSILGFPRLGLGECLILPQSFGNIYLGETFMSYVSLHNDSTEVCDHVILKCDLQTATQRLPLLSPNQPEADCQLPPGSSIDHVLSHEVKELGTHILVCEVFYNSPAKGKLNFRKFFKFQVMKPLDVKTKFYNAESEDVFLEAQVQNVTSGHLCLEKVSLEPSPMFRMASLNSIAVDGDAEKEVPVFGRINFLQPQDSRQYLFSLTPRNDLRTNYKQLRGATNIGKLDIVWRTNMGDRGRLQTSQLQRISPLHGDIRFNIEKVTNIAVLNQVFQLNCLVFNNSDRTLDLELFLESVNKPRMIWSGATSKKLGLIEPAGSTEVVLEVIPQDTGLQTLSGVRLKDTSLMRTYPFDDLCHVYVTADEMYLKAEDIST